MRFSHKLQYTVSAYVMVSLGDVMALRIRDLREDRDKKQKEIAELLHISQATYSRYETGDLDIPHSALQTLADFYETSVDYLLGRTDVKKPYPEKK